MKHLKGNETPKFILWPFFKVTSLSGTAWLDFSRLQVIESTNAETDQLILKLQKITNN